MPRVLEGRALAVPNLDEVELTRGTDGEGHSCVGAGEHPEPGSERERDAKP